jgi:hypothetical protein
MPKVMVEIPSLGALCIRLRAVGMVDGVARADKAEGGVTRARVVGNAQSALEVRLCGNESFKTGDMASTDGRRIKGRREVLESFRFFEASPL